MAKIYLTPEERAMIELVLKEGFGQPGEPQWLVARLALARSLQLPNRPAEDLGKAGTHVGGTEIHDAQMTGHGGSGHEDFRDVFAALLSVREGEDCVGDPDVLDEAINRHVRRGLEDFRLSQGRKFDFVTYLLQEMYLDGGEAGGGQDAEGSRVKERLEGVLGQLGIGFEVLGHQNGPRLTRVTLELHRLDDLDRLRKGLSKIAFALGLGEESVSIGLLPAERRVSLDVPRPVSSWSTVTWTELGPALDACVSDGMKLPICVGTDVLGDALVRDLVDAPHLFVAGTTGSGKSMCLHAILLSVIRRPETCPDLVLIDPKGVEFGEYSSLSRLRTGRPIVDMNEAEGILTDLIDEMEQRQEKLGALGARNIAEANEYGAQLSRIVVFVDEVADLFTTHPEAERSIIRLAQKARAVGIHLVLATQRPDAATFSGLLRSNIPSRIALTVQKNSESRIILDDSGAENLLMRGDMLVRFAGQNSIRAHGCLVQPGDVAREVRAR